MKSSAGGAAGVGKRVNPGTLSWRFGPAKVWYDQIGVPEDGSSLSYGFKVKEVRCVLCLAAGVSIQCVVLCRAQWQRKRGRIRMTRTLQKMLS